MASSKDFIDFVMDQIHGAGEITAKKMFGEYGVYSDGKIFGLVCDNKLFIKPTLAGRKFIGNPVEAPPYPGAKPSFLIEEQLDNSQWLSELIKVSLLELPVQKQNQKKGNMLLTSTMPGSPTAGTLNPIPGTFAPVKR